MESRWVTGLFVATTILLIQHFCLASAGSIGVNHGLNGDNLPPAAQVVDLCERCHISSIRFFEPRPDMLEALRGTPVLVALGTRNEDVPSIAQDQNAANAWVNTNIVPYVNDVNFGYITLGNEVIPWGAEAPYVAQAILNIMMALTLAGIEKDINVTTVLHAGCLAVSYPPSAGSLTDETANDLKDIASLLALHGTPMMINVYPYYSYVNDLQNVPLDYALFQSTVPVVIDGDYQYYNIFDAMVDAFHAAFEKIGVPNLSIVVSETGWPSAGNEPYTSIANAQTYNKNLIAHVLSGKGTPRRPGESVDTFLFELFNEDLKSPGIEQNFGTFYPNMQPVYPLWSC